ncbi:bifunctional 5,10-methylenetetrahydrofolate dehydrogenase/5,10-methenyltetrahydrofolate cyclohydrolase [Heliophilum fasciatum]|uniref:Bifunctional protein FolD n=1 Tax=Heliophilum fasciatum TaxID=35700 RepID=A0A4R2RV34_9FIRM|nr:bifunctional 5,10-methylenetetrahydrofolate dehydrogenase/5,10-methenyltetrahydrofolate cyclohydrolase [Heliophilum fasciatum]MCW2278336.1 methylenetetrahydrofolate dehydrogenase (NADP+)/methenyltetrahydrofolate cyclohydrolase [Heliophilum fasciatum]TCP63791.1 methylenetetrahydrofolate dehydrogenase (NADP+)/methenyltetrahydrofolate cyclohydrolase [Heliophilum fasciatum]
MGAVLIDGKQVAASLREALIREVAEVTAQGIVPKLAVVLVGDDPASVVYARSKEKAAAKVGIAYELHHLPGTTAEADVLALVAQLNQDKTVHGILVELPLPKGMDKQRVMAAVDPLKDVDGMHPANRGALLSDAPALVAATPLSCIALLDHAGVDLNGKRVVLVGRGETVGKPLFFLLLKRNATVTVCHTRTRDMAAEVRRGEIVIAAAGKAGLITKDMVAPGAIVIDAGINETPEGGITGDVAPDVAEAAGMLSPVPGGVGSCTTVLLFHNVLRGLKMQHGL